MISNVVHDLPFNWKQPLKRADDYYIGILKKYINKILRYLYIETAVHKIKKKKKTRWQETVIESWNM